MTVETLRVHLGDRSYDIFIGDKLLERAGEYLRPHLSRPRTVVITDENVWRAHGMRLASGLTASNITHEVITLQPGENSKSFSTLEFVTERLLELSVERDDLIVAFGGGVIGDLTGFAASVLRRGCKFAQIPTTLLAQVDSAVGGKTAINSRHGKNLIGAFHQPCVVVSDIGALETLPKREMRAGYAEILKYALIGDDQFFDWLESNGASTLSASGGEKRRYAVQKSCTAKSDIVAVDEHEHGSRALLNLGHTFGHAFEAAFGFSDRLLHGEAVAAGLALAFDYSVWRGHCAKNDAERIKAHLAVIGLPSLKDILVKEPSLSSEAICALMMQDKKIKNGEMTLILVNSIGDAFIQHDAAQSDIKRFLKEKFAR